MKQNNLKAFGIVAVFLLLVSMLTVSTASLACASPTGADAKKVAQAARQMTTSDIVYKKNGVSDKKMDSTHLVFSVYFSSGVTGYFGEIKPKNIKKCPNFVSIRAPGIGDVVYWKDLGIMGIFTGSGEVVTISKELGRPSRVMINEYPYNHNPEYFRWQYPAPTKLK